MACDCLGPRGDDKSGVRDSWLAYCFMEEKTSTMTSFRENRFNNTFQGAANLHFHRQDIQDCLGNYLPNRNKKVEVVLADCQSELTDCHIIALGLLYFRLTGPYWSLLGSRVHYLDFHMSVERMHAALRDWQQDASPLLRPDCQAVFPGIEFRHNADILTSLLDMDDTKKEGVKCVLKKVCAGMVVVTERQLADFLHNGRYHNVQDQDLRHKLSHSHITNLVAEECFADLDFSLFKRRSCSLFHHSTVNMMKRNKPNSSSYLRKSDQEQRELLKMSATKSAALREKHVLAEKNAIRRRERILQDNLQKKQAADVKRRQRVACFRSCLGDSLANICPRDRTKLLFADNPAEN
ncbi:uncharacterized protein [Littorina saxatilis]|uniref:uncharacterized protein n=1 Tax=Littorina saxatilis TaxID=31220 RepID=UPI0038B61B66